MLRKFQIKIEESIIDMSEPYITKRPNCSQVLEILSDIKFTAEDYKNFEVDFQEEFIAMMNYEFFSKFYENKKKNHI